MKTDPWLRKKQIFSPSFVDISSKQKSKKKWRILPVLWLAFKKTSTVIGAFVIISSLIMAWGMSSFLSEIEKAAVQNVHVPSNMVLYMEIDGDVGELPKKASFSDPFSSNDTTFRDYLDAIERAARDPRVKGIYARINAGGMSVAHIQEIREALERFKKSGKFTYIYSPAFDHGIGAYYLASAFDEIWMQPMGVVMISGINAEMPYLRNVLDKIGVKPQIYKRKEYKSAYDMFTEKHMSKDNRVAMSALISDISDSIRSGVSHDMVMDEKELEALVNKGLFMDTEALDAGLIDVLDYEDVLIKEIKETVTGDSESKEDIFFSFSKYVDIVAKERISHYQGMVSRRGQNIPKVAIVYAVGTIVDVDESKASTGLGGRIAAADQIAPALLDVAEDDSYDAVVLRVDSPGGSPVASETILRAVQKVQYSGKTVIVSMGATAASGGYWISSAADQIFVMPGTITGSIGVLGGKYSVAELWENLGVNWDRVGWGEKSAMWSMNAPYNEAEAERVNAMMDNVYDNFIQRVAKGRDLDEKEVEKIARGRVWSGKRAVEIGLADKIGGLNDALDYAAVQLGRNNRRGVIVEVVPKPLTPFEQLVEMLNSQVKAGEAMQIQAALIKAVMPDFVTEALANSRIQRAGVSVYDPAVNNITRR